MCGTLDVLGGVGPFDPGLGHVEHLPLLGLGRGLCADLLVLLDPVLGEVPAAHLAGRQIVPGLGRKQGAPRRGGRGLQDEE